MFDNKTPPDTLDQIHFNRTNGVYCVLNADREDMRKNWEQNIQTSIGCHSFLFSYIFKFDSIIVFVAIECVIEIAGPTIVLPVFNL